MSCSFRKLGPICAFALWLAFATLPGAALAQSLSSIDGQTRLQRHTAFRLSNVCASLTGLLGLAGRDNGSTEGDLLGRCNDLIESANALPGMVGATDNSLDLTEAQINAALESLVHMQLAAIGKSASEIGILQAGVVSDRLHALRAGAEGFQISANLRDSEGNPVDLAFDLFEDSGAAGVGPPWLKGLGAYLHSSAGLGDRKSNDEELGFDYHDLGITAGVDYRINSQTIAGLALGYNYGARRFDRNGGNLRTNTFSGWLYGGYQYGRLHVDATYGYSYHDIETRRRITVPIGAAPGAGNPPTAPPMGVHRRATGQTNADEHLISGDVGYIFALQDLRVGPTWKLQYINLDVANFTESGAGGLNLDVDDDKVESLVFTVGGDAAYDFSTRIGVITPQLAIGWGHQFRDDQRLLTAHFASDASRTRFAVQSKEPDRDFIDVSASVSAEFASGFSAFVSYDTLLAHDDLDAHLLTIGGRFVF